MTLQYSTYSTQVRAGQGPAAHRLPLSGLYKHNCTFSGQMGHAVQWPPMSITVMRQFKTLLIACIICPIHACRTVPLLARYEVASVSLYIDEIYLLELPLENNGF